ncbi:MAG: glycosyltransferase family 2 protein [Chthoniobacterales bacterium]|nr:glycosyltransferase family 2 protein [Chthoniobacterales bacterium]
MKYQGNPSPRVAAVIATYRRDRELGRLIEALKAGTLPPARIDVADSADSEETRGLCARMGARWIPLPINRGPGPAWNAAIAAALADDSVTHLLVLDDDVVPPADALETMLRVAGGTGSGAVAPLLFDEKGALWGFPEPQEPALRPAIRRVTDKASALAALGGDPHPFCWATGACILYRRDVFDRCGMFREDFWMLGEDLHFSMRAARTAGGVFTAQVAVAHFSPPPCDPRGAALGHRQKFLALLQNLSYLAFRSPDSAHLRSYLPGNFRRYLRTEGWKAANAQDAATAFWLGAVLGHPAGTASGAKLRERAQKRFGADRF